jgi:alginate O-acetyltransferase complex protein AlgI
MYIFICVTWVLFRSPSFTAAATMLHKMSGLAPGGIAWFYSPLAMVLPLVISGHAIGILAPRRTDISGAYLLLPSGFTGAFLAALWILALVLFGATGANPFIYFQF